RVAGARAAGQRGVGHRAAHVVAVGPHPVPLGVPLERCPTPRDLRVRVAHRTARRCCSAAGRKQHRYDRTDGDECRDGSPPPLERTAGQDSHLFLPGRDSHAYRPFVITKAGRSTALAYVPRLFRISCSSGGGGPEGPPPLVRSEPLTGRPPSSGRPPA